MELNVNASLGVAGKVIKVTAEAVKNNLFWGYLSRVLPGFFLVMAGLFFIPVQETLGDVEIQSISLNPPANGESYRWGEEINIILTFTDTVTVDVTRGDLFIDAFIGGSWRGPRYSRSAGSTVSFSYTVGHRDGNLDVGMIGIGSHYNILRYNNGGKVQHDGKDVKKTFYGSIDSFHVDARVWIESIEVSLPDNKGTFLRGDEIFIDVHFEKPVVAEGDLFLDAFIGSWRQPFYLETLRSGNTLRYRYVVKEGDIGRLLIGSSYNILRFGTGGNITHDGYRVRPTFRGHIDTRKVHSDLTPYTTQSCKDGWDLSAADDDCDYGSVELSNTSYDNPECTFREISCLVPGNKEGTTVTYDFIFGRTFSVTDVSRILLCRIRFYDGDWSVVNWGFTTNSSDCTTDPITTDL